MDKQCIKSSESDIQKTEYRNLSEIKPYDLALNIYKKENGGNDMPDELKDMLNKVIEEVEQ